MNGIKPKKKEEKKARKAKRAQEEQNKKLQEQQRKEHLKAKQQAKQNKKLQEESDDDDDDGNKLTEKELSMLRGYKKTSDGRTTSYFTREQSMKEKQLIGDITPQRLGPNGEPLGDGPAKLSITTTAAGHNSGSAWNQAGTWEEKNTTDWCSSRLKDRLLEANTPKEEEGESGYAGIVATIKDIPEFSGDASVATAGGKKRYIFDFHCKVNFEILLRQNDDSNDNAILAKGSFQLPDINSGSHEEPEIQTYPWTTAPPPEHAEGVTRCRLALMASIRQQVKQFVQDFNSNF